MPENTVYYMTGLEAFVVQGLSEKLYHNLF